MIEFPKFTIDIAVVTGCLAIIGIIGRLFYRTSRYLDHLSCMLDAWEGTPERPGVLDRLDDIEDKLKDVQYHVKPNHGGSSIDAQNRQIAEILTYLRSK
jgi:putative holin